MSTSTPTTVTGSSRITRGEDRATISALVFEHLVAARNDLDEQLRARGLDPAEFLTAAITLTVEVELP